MSWSYTPFWVIALGAEQEKLKRGEITLKQYKDWIRESDVIPEYTKEHFIINAHTLLA